MIPTTIPGMQVNQFVLTIASERPGALLAFYRDVLGLPAAAAPSSVRAGGAVLMFNGCDRRAVREPGRYRVNLEVEDIAVEQARIEAQGVSFLRRKGRGHWGGIVSTLLDPDGNHVQLFQHHNNGLA